MRTLKIFALLILTCATISGCTWSPPGDFERTYCRVDNAISWSKRDTDQTIREVKDHNAVHDNICK